MSKVKVDKNFHWYKQVKYVEKMFRKTFKKEIKLKEFYYTNEANYGAFGFKYYYFPKDLILFFDYQTLFFEIKVIRSDGIETDLSLIATKDSELKNEKFSQLMIDSLSNIKFWKKIG